MRWSYFAIILVVGLVSTAGISPLGLAQNAQVADDATLRPQDTSRGSRQATGAFAAPLAIKEVKPGVYMVTGRTSWWKHDGPGHEPGPNPG